MTAKLEPDKLRIITLQSAVVHEGDFYLAGGTGLGIRLAHRFSEDLDWFTAKDFSAPELAARLSSLPTPTTKVEVQGPHTLRAYYGTLETSFIRYTQVLAKPEIVHVGGQAIPLADVALAASMKAGAVYNRGTKRDFIDIHAICSLPGWSIGRFIEHAASSLPLQDKLLARALTYFQDAERQPMPRGCTVKWDCVKVEISKGVLEWQRNRDRGIER